MLKPIKKGCRRTLPLTAVSDAILSMALAQSSTVANSTPIPSRYSCISLPNIGVRTYLQITKHQSCIHALLVLSFWELLTMVQPDSLGCFLSTLSDVGSSSTLSPPIWMCYTVGIRVDQHKQQYSL